MNNLLLILKSDMMNSFQINKLRNPSSKKEKNKIIGMSLLYIVTSVLLGYSFYIVFAEIGEMLYMYNQLDLLLYIAIMGAICSTIFTGIYKIPGYLLSSKDYDILLTLPISHKTILASKMIYLIVLDYIFSAFLIFPPAIVYFVISKPSFVFIVNLLVMFIFIPLIPMVISSLISLILGKMTSKFKYKNHLLTISSIVLVIGIMYLSYDMQDIITNIVANSDNISKAIQKIYFPAYFFVDALINFNFMSIMIFMLLSLGIFIMFIQIFSKEFRKINAIMGESYKLNNYKMTSLKESKIIQTLLNKEIKRYLSSSIYVLNTSIGMILLIVISIGAFIFGKEQIASMLEIPNVGDMLYVYMLFIMCMLTVMSCTTHVSISIEGKNLWILKSSPIEIMDIFKSKIILNLIITIPVIILSSLLLSNAFEFSTIQSLSMMTLTSLYAIFISINGLVINLNLPKLEWTSEVSVVKQSMSVIMSIVIGFLSILIPVGLYLVLNVEDTLILIVITSIALTILSIIEYMYLNKEGKKKFNQL